MEDLKMNIWFIEWGLVIILTIVLFTYFSKKYKSFGRLFPLVLIPTWIILSVIKGIENMYFYNTTEILSLGGFTMLMAETFAMVLVLGVTTFGIKYVKFRKNLLKK